MKKSQFWAFTLIEFMVAVTIFVLISLMAFAPYSYYINKSKVKQTGKEVSQLIYESKNMALNGIVWETSNISVWVYFDVAQDDIIKVIPFDYSITPDAINPTLVENALTASWLTQLILQPWIELESINNQTKWLIYFQAITWSWWVYSWNTLQKIPWNTNVDIEFSYKNSNASTLRKTIKYIQKTQIVDY